jgi:hypothetical protein
MGPTPMWIPTRRSFLPLALGAVLTFVVAASACDAEGNAFIQPVAVGLVIVGPDTLRALDATAHYRVDGLSSATQTVRWSSSQPTVLAPGEPGGTFVARRPGTARVRATTGARSAEMQVVVWIAPPPVLTLAVSGDTVLTRLDDTLRISATVWLSSGEQITSVDAEWRSSEPAVAAVEAGRVVARGNGRALITARSHGAEASLAVRVAIDTATPPEQPAPPAPPEQPAPPAPPEQPAPPAPPEEPQRPVMILTPVADTLLTSLGDTLEVRATLRQGSGQETTPTEVEWQSSDPVVATVSAGRVIARSNGRAIITARAAGVEAGLPVRVSQAAAALELSADDYTIPGPGRSVQLQATLRDRRGSPINGVPLTWNSSHPTRIAVSASGLATAPAFGSATVTASALGFSRSAPIRVTGGAAPTIDGLHAGITRVGSDPLASYVVVQAELRDSEQDMDSVHVVLFDAAGSVLLRHREAISQGVELFPLAVHAAAAVGATQARIEAFDAAGHLATRTVALRASPTPQSPRIESVEIRRPAPDSVHVELEAAGAEADVEMLWIVGLDQSGDWTQVMGIPIDTDGWREWFLEVGIRSPAVARTRSFGILLRDAAGNLSVLHLVAAGTEGGAASTPSAAVPRRPTRLLPQGASSIGARYLRPVVRLRPRGG